MDNLSSISKEQRAINQREQDTGEEYCFHCDTHIKSELMTANATHGSACHSCIMKLQGEADGF